MSKVTGRELTLVAAITASAIVGLGAAPVAHGYAETFCNGVLYAPGLRCGGNWADWDRVRSRYPGHEAHDVVACVFEQDFDGNIRGGAIYCDRTWSDPTWNPMGHNWGTSTGLYRSFNMLQSSPSHSLVGWASTNQTDG